MIVGAVLDVLAILANLMLKSPVDPAPTQRPPPGGLGMIGKRQPGGIEAGSFSDEVIVVLRTGVDERRWDAGSVRSDRIR